MRRKDKEISDWADIKAILEAECILHMAMIDGNEPYLVALNYGFDGKTLYFHSGKEGRKIDILSKSECCRVCFMVERYHGIVERATGSPVPSFTSRFQSVIGRGNVRRETDPETIRRELNRIIFQSTRKQTDYTFTACQGKTELFRIDIETASGKQSAMDC